MKTRTIVMNDFIREYKYLRIPIKNATDLALEKGWYILGNKVEEFEKQFAAYIGTRYSISVANGYEALYIALLALGIGKGDEVITVSHSFIATSLPITMVGAKPVYVDIDEYYHMDPKRVESAITPRTKAILPVHLYGQIVNIREIMNIAKKHRLKVIEDACQAHGATYKGKKAGSFGAISAFSFYPTKNLGAFGDGGAITTDSKSLFKKCLRLRNYGQEVKYKHVSFGINSRLDEMQAAILIEKLKVLDRFVKNRNSLAQQYIKNLSGILEIKLPETRRGHYHSFHLFVIEAEKRDALQEYLKKSGIQSMVHYPVPIHKQEVYKQFNRLYIPRTEEAAKSVLSLPMHPLMKKEEVIRVCDAVKTFYQEQ